MKRRSLFGALAALALPAVAAPKPVVRAYPVEAYELNEPAFTPRPGWRYVTLSDPGHTHSMLDPGHNHYVTASWHDHRAVHFPGG